MQGSEVFAVLAVFERLQDIVAEHVNLINLLVSCRRFKLFDDETYYRLLRRFSVRVEEHSAAIKLFYDLMVVIFPLTSVSTLKWIFTDAGYSNISREITLQLSGNISSWPVKRAIPHSDILDEYFANLKRCADSKSFQDGTVYRLESLITALDKKVKNCVGNSGRLQLFVDKRVMTYFLLAQQYSDMDKRLAIMKRMRNTVSHGDIDTSLFDTIYHSYMVVIRSIKGDMAAAEDHEARARHVDSQTVPGFVSIILRLCVQYKNNIAFFRHHNNDDLQNATTDFEDIFRMFHYLERNTDIYGTIAQLEMVHTLLGIDWNLEVNPVGSLKQQNLEKAEVMLSSISKPVESRRKMLYCLCRARILEKVDPMQAEVFATKAYVQAYEGTYYDVEKQNIENYVKKLKSAQIVRCPTSKFIENSM